MLIEGPVGRGSGETGPAVVAGLLRALNVPKKPHSTTMKKELRY